VARGPARLIGSLIGLTDEQFNRETDGPPGQWTYRVVAKHGPRGRKRPSPSPVFP